MAEEKCSICGMTVRNMQVHLKLNHKKKKKPREIGGSGFTGFTPSPPTKPKPKASVVLTPNLDRITLIAQPKNDSPFSRAGKSEARDETQDDGGGSLSEANLGMLADLRSQEKQAFRKYSGQRHAGHRGWGAWPSYPQRKEHPDTRQCPECRAVLPWNRGGHKFSNREFFDHVKTCGLGGGVTPTKALLALQERVRLDQTAALAAIPLGDQEDLTLPNHHEDVKQEAASTEANSDNCETVMSRFKCDKCAFLARTEDRLMKHKAKLHRQVLRVDLTIEDKIDLTEDSSGDGNDLNNYSFKGPILIEDDSNSKDARAVMIEEELSTDDTVGSSITSELILDKKESLESLEDEVKLEPERNPSPPMVQIKLEETVSLLCDTTGSIIPKVETESSLAPPTTSDTSLECLSLPGHIVFSQSDLVFLSQEPIKEPIHQKLGQEWFQKISAIEAKISGSSGGEGSGQPKKGETRKKRFKSREERGEGSSKANKAKHCCPVIGCSKRFSRKDELTRHRWVHTREERFRCLMCGGAFSRADRLRAHSLTCSSSKGLVGEDMGDIAETSSEGEAPTTEEDYVEEGN